MGLADKNNEIIKFDKVVRTKQGEALTALIFASYWNEKNDESLTREDIAERLIHANHIFKLGKGGAYGNNRDPRAMKKQFQRFYTIGHDMGIWMNSSLELSPYAKKVATFEITVKEYISTVFLNLFTYVNDEYTHILYNTCEYMLKNKKEDLDMNDLRNLFGTSPKTNIESEQKKLEDEVKEQLSIIFNYFLSSNFFIEEGKALKLAKGYSWSKLKEKCNLEYQNKNIDETRKYFSVTANYSTYISTRDDDSQENQKAEVIEILEQNRPYETKKIVFDEEFKQREQTIQKIIFGPPGIGKSFSVKNEIRKSYPEYEDASSNPFVFRTTLHPEYDYVSFVGQVMPVVREESIIYEFSPGIFTESLKKAIEVEKCGNDVYLILEEMSRANVAAVFGDIFQLLDRSNGVSDYMINNDLIAREIYGDPNRKIYLPRNFNIIGTVNASDQNVYVMDTAFKRRFDFSYMDLAPKFDEKKNQYLNSYKLLIKVDETSEFIIDWVDFYQELNNYIVEKLELSEDKQVGQFFIKFTDNNIVNTWSLLDKLFHYLWQDVQKVAYTENRIFKPELLTFSHVYSEMRNSIKKSKEENSDLIPITVFSPEFIRQIERKKNEQ